MDNIPHGRANATQAPPPFGGNCLAVEIRLQPHSGWVTRYSETARRAGLPAELASDNSD
jgi:hypothetical protein